MYKISIDLPPSLTWRWSLYNEYWFYFRTCKNFREVIRSRRSGSELPKIEMRNGLVINTVGENKYFLVIFREIWQRETYVKLMRKYKLQTIVDIGAHAGLLRSRFQRCGLLRKYMPTSRNQRTSRYSVGMFNKIIWQVYISTMKLSANIQEL
jgi:hypothetical protein